MGFGGNNAYENFRLWIDDDIEGSSYVGGID